MNREGNRPVSAADLQFMLEHYLPKAHWTVGGALRFDRSLLTLNTFINQNFPLRRLDRVAGTPPCLWSLDWFTKRAPLNMDMYAERLESYARLNCGVALVFDNPFIAENMLQNVHANQLVRELHRCDRIRKNAIYVASDLLASYLRDHGPKLPIFCHPNRLIVEIGKRTPDLYNKLATKYDRVCLHPADAARPTIYKNIATPEKFDTIINDPCLRNCSIRREHMRLLAEIRQAPYDTALNTRREQMIARNGCHTIESSQLRQKLTCNLTREESIELYETGFQSFIIQSNQFRNEITLLWDIFQCMLDHSPSLSNKSALIAVSAMAQLGTAQKTIPSGLRGFSFTNYE